MVKSAEYIYAEDSLSSELTYLGCGFLKDGKRGSKIPVCIGIAEHPFQK